MNTISQVVAGHARDRGDRVAFVDAATGQVTTWAEYDELADRIAERYRSEVEPGDRVAIQMDHTARLHAAYVGFERLGVVVVGIGERAGEREVEHLMTVTGATKRLRHIESAATRVAEHAPPHDDALWFLNSTSGTTGLPKCVMHHQARWFAFHRFAERAARFATDDVFCSLLPAPFGFGLWTAHFTPAIVGAPCVLLDRFTPEAAIAALVDHRVSVLAAVSTQFVMMLEAPALDAATAPANHLSLRALFTGGEMVPYERALEWETRTGSRVLQFYGSNETGALSGTTLDDPTDVRLRTAGRVLPEMHVRLLDPDTDDDVADGEAGVAACRGPATCLGYLDDPDANAQLVTADGWMKTGDLCTVDADGVLTVQGRVSDFIIRGGKNLSAAVIEQEVASHPAVRLAAAVAKPDPVYGERVCVFCVVDTHSALTLADLQAHLDQRGVGRELWPEFVVAVHGDLPRSSGGKVAKGELRARAAEL